MGETSMTITIKLTSGKTIELTEDEYREIYGLIGPKLYHNNFPIYPQPEYPGWGYPPLITYCTSSPAVPPDTLVTNKT